MHHFQVGLPARGKSYLSNKLMRYLKVSCNPFFPPWTENPLSLTQWLEYDVKAREIPQPTLFT
jgi:hypothetical protein